MAAVSKTQVNMTEIAEYIHVPLNTATGIINRMEKNGLIERTRSQEDNYENSNAER